jgi:hypothetical protein
VRERERERYVSACGGGNQLKNSHKAAASFVWVVGIQFISRNLFVTFVFVWAGAQCFILSAGAGRTSVRLLYARRSLPAFSLSLDAVPTRIC